MDQEINPFIQKILDYSKGKTVITYDEITALAGQDFINSPDMEQALQFLAKENVEVIESGLSLDDDEDDEDISVEDDEPAPYPGNL